MGIKLEAARGDFTSLGGLTIFGELFDRLDLKSKLYPYFPGAKKAALVNRNYQKFRNMALGFVAGAECLEDMVTLNQDPGFVAICKNQTFQSNTYGEFLRSFEPWQLRQINEVLAATALKIRRRMFADERRFILDIDSTDHRQYGFKIEGAAFNHKHNWGLDSLQAFDQFGFQYWMEVREGNSFTANNAPYAIEKIFAHVPKDMSRYLRADSGFCNHAVLQACIQRNIDFVITMRATMYEPLLPRVTHWHPAQKSSFRGRACEIGSTIYYPEGFTRAMRVVFIRARKTQPNLFEDKYDYAAWVTSIGEREMNDENLVCFYKKRGNAENFIRELKNGFDIHHFPCLKMIANKAYGLIAAFAYNLMRHAAWTLDNKTPRFSKMMRFRMVYLAGQVVRKARSWIIRLNPNHYKEVINWLNNLKLKFGYG